ncbi:G-type lectin S-receptor-like serine/threonine-protein kinase LECRK2 [Cannabis sativa]|nr:G-type lectin S-receptor-like serine/threonine-protein kinase LECRK2 [Cannabis sativa]
MSHLFTLLFIPFSVVLSQFNGLVTLNETLTAGDKDAFWLSPSKDFAFGFHRLINNDNVLDFHFTDEHYLLAIWYYKLGPDVTIVWHANATTVPRGSTLELNIHTGLVLITSSSQSGDQVVWKTELKEGEGGGGGGFVSYGLMKDTGNFVLLDENRTVIWESFRHPTDTLLPTQTMKIGDVLYSQKSLTDFSPGEFKFSLHENGNVLLNFTSLFNFETPVTYHKIGFNIGGHDYQINFDAKGNLYLLSSDRKICIAKSDDAIVSPSKHYLKVTLNFHGVLSLSYCPKSNHNTTEMSWKVLKAIPDDICNDLIVPRSMGTGPCGYNSICKVRDDGIPTCKCPLGYSFLNPNSNYSGCKPDFQQLCDHNGNKMMSMKDLPKTDWPQSDYELIEPSDYEECKNNCLLDCNCFVAIFNFDNNRCFKNRLPLSNGRESETLKHSMASIKYMNASLINTLHIPSSNKTYKIIMTLMFILLGGSLLINAVVLSSSLLNCSNKLIRSNGNSVVMSLRQFTCKELTEATNGFKEELGRGSYGIVYKGQTEFGTDIAVKLLKRLFSENEKEFQAELNIIGQTHQKNLVKLVGYCNERKHRLLVYEYMSNGTLASFLFRGPKPSWNQRTRIAIGIARGLFYLHEDCSTTQIIHCDIKPQNVLLDDCHNARISDFGMAKILGLSQTHNSSSSNKTSIRGTKGYIAPEWFRSSSSTTITTKVDVYSYGVMLLEIVSCRRNEIDLVDLVYECYNNERLEDLVENDIEAMDEIEMVERFVKVGLWCLNEDPSKRPSMKMVLLMLEGIVVVSSPSTSPAYSSYSSSSNT